MLQRIEDGLQGSVASTPWHIVYRTVPSNNKTANLLGKSLREIFDALIAGLYDTREPNFYDRS